METVIKRRGRPPGSGNKSENTKDWMTQTAPEPTPKVTTTEPTPAPLKRVYAKTQKLNHDLFKLEEAKLLRNVSYTDSDPVFESVGHGHFYHSIDSRGTPQRFSNKVGGHFHEIIIEPNGNIICSPPLIEIKNKKHGRRTIEYKELSYDDHVHTVTYRFSEEITPTSPNAEWAKVQAGIANTQVATSIPDVEVNE